MPRSVTVQAGKHVIQLPDGLPHEGGATVILTDEQWALISPTAVSSGLIVDNGAVDATDLVSVQGAHQAAPAALTSSAPSALTSVQNATTAASDPTTTQALANALKASYNALQTDVAADHATLVAVQADVAALRTELAAAITALTGSGKPLASS